MDRMENDTQVRRRRYGPELKARVVAECEAPGASVAKVAMVHGINANIVHGWRKLSREGNGTLQIGPSVEAGWLHLLQRRRSFPLHCRHLRAEMGSQRRRFGSSSSVVAQR